MLPDRQIVTRVHLQHLAMSAIQPRDHDDPLSDAKVLKALLHGRLEDQPRVGRAFVSLFRCRLPVGEWRFDEADGSENEVVFHGWILGSAGGMVVLTKPMTSMRVSERRSMAGDDVLENIQALAHEEHELRERE